MTIKRCEDCGAIEPGWIKLCRRCRLSGLTPAQKAAGDLLAACDQLVRFCEMMNMPDDLRTIEKGRAAIAKAEGESND